LTVVAVRRARHLDRQENHAFAGAILAWLLSFPSENTQRTYRVHIEQWIEWALPYGIDPLSPRRVEVDGWATHLRRGGLSPASVNAKLCALSSLLGYLVDEGVRTDNPAARVKRAKVATDHHRTPALSDDEAAKVLAVAAKDSQRSRVIIAVFLTLGIRVSELVNADVEHLTSEAGHSCLTVVRKGGRTDLLVVPVPVAEDIATHLAGRTSGPILTTITGARMDRHAVRKTILRLALTAGVENAERIGPHALRRTTITMELERGTPPHIVQQKAGHTDVKTNLLYLRSRNALRDQSAVTAVTAATVYARLA
jgi:site-specific recombinase XerD